MATLLIPAAVTFVPSLVLVSTLGWISTLRGLIIPGLFQAFATFLFRQYFLGFPRELEEAAQLDSAGYWVTFWRIVVPNSLGFIAAAGVDAVAGADLPDGIRQLVADRCRDNDLLGGDAALGSSENVGLAGAEGLVPSPVRRRRAWGR